MSDENMNDNIRILGVIKCQFLIGNVRHARANVHEQEWNDYEESVNSS